MQLKKHTKEDWFSLGMQSLSKYGEESLRVEKLCKELKVTKGSFYHHFKNIEVYIIELMKYWELTKTENIINAANAENSFVQKIQKLNHLVLKQDHLVEVRIRAWGIRNRKVHDFIEHIDEKRIAYLKSLYLEKKYTDEEADCLAKLEYAAFVGMQQLFLNLPIEEKIKISEKFYSLLNTNPHETSTKQW